MIQIPRPGPYFMSNARLIEVAGAPLDPCSQSAFSAFCDFTGLLSKDCGGVPCVEGLKRGRPLGAWPGTGRSGSLAHTKIHLNTRVTCLRSPYYNENTICSKALLDLPTHLRWQFRTCRIRRGAFKANPETSET